ncbi:hypothetical protein [Limnofasciculus baicalensis]|uniref:Uncharacterized protein n=1 Tax=Limnofasciculus baicalensis BBK-W-15 TaxID=2699891 RepID=A0AAE3GTV5_9CYAN|nr:hypothetical protein [Limnofasciculus baicalensis]MCP2730645.1 hypothetical protein [Limnofasciculus baicalensis BBK-W-15]
MNTNGCNSKLVKMYLTSTKLINLTIIIAIVGISSFGCQNSAPKQTKTQASPVTQADTETTGIDPADIPTLPQNVPDDPLLSPTLPENSTDLATQPDPQVDLPKLPETKALSPRKSKPQTVAPKEPETQALLPTPETDAVSPTQKEIKQLLPTDPEIKPLLPSEPEIQSLLPTKPKIQHLSPIKPETPTVFLTPPETQISLLRPPKREASPSSFMDIKNLPDGNYFYGESTESNRPGKEYLVFKKKGDLIIGQQYILQTDNAHCFRGTANSSQINNVKTAYFQPSDNGMQLAFGQMDAIGTNNLHQLGFEKAPDFVADNLQQCIRVFTQEKISMAY